MKQAALKGVLQGLMNRYKERVPDVPGVIKAMIDEGIINDFDEVENDHIAFRTIGVPHLGIPSLEKIFLAYGYQKRDHYHFAEKKLDAYWYAPPSPEFPRIFISELLATKLSVEAQQIIHKYTDTITSDPVDGLNLDDAAEVDAFLHSPLWETPSLQDYERLLEESEYAAWTIYNRYYLNHFTISIHNLKAGYNDLASFNAFLLAKGFKLNDSGGQIKTSPDGKLSQSSTVAGKVEATFKDGDKKLIAGSYVEFAERKVLDEFVGLPAAEIKREHRREGFEANNADKIFESTFLSQTEK